MTAVIDLRDEDIVLGRQSSQGRFVLFTCGDLPAVSSVGWSVVIFHTGGDGVGVPIMLDSAEAIGWDALAMLELLIWRCQSERDRIRSEAAEAVVRHLLRAAELEMVRTGVADFGGRLQLLPGPLPSPYRWCSVRYGAFELTLCPDPQGRDEGIAPEQLLIALDQLYADGSRTRPGDRRLRACSRHVASALAAEIRRIAQTFPVSDRIDDLPTRKS